MTAQASRCFAPIQAEVIRVISLNSCGLPVTGATGRTYVTDGFISVANSPQYEEGQRFLQRQASGRPCVNTKGSSFLNWVEQTVSLCTIDPRMLGTITGMTNILASTTATGMHHTDALLDDHFSVELWSPIAGAGACDAGGQWYMYWLYPNMYDAKIQDFTNENDVFTLPWTAQTQGVTDGATWNTLATAATGSMSPVQSAPFLYLGSNAITTGDHYAFNFTQLAPPAAYCGGQSPV